MEDDEILKQQIVQEAVENYEGDKDPEQVRADVEDLTHKLFKEGKVPKDAIGVSDKMLEGIYGFGYRLYNTGKYQQAIQLFRLLTMLDPTKSKYMYALGACFHMSKEYNMATLCYTLCNVIDPKNPLPYFHASDCYFHLNNLDMAKKSLKACVNYAEKSPEHKIIQERAQFMLGQIEKGGAVKAASSATLQEPTVQPQQKEQEQKK